MKIFGINFTTKKELKARVNELEVENEELLESLGEMLDTFPFYIGQVVYDVALKNDKGRYTKVKPSFEHSTITEVTVSEKNYFSLAARLRRNDVFFEREEAEDYLADVCE
jgi:hypothetical protein